MLSPSEAESVSFENGKAHEIVKIVAGPYAQRPSKMSDQCRMDVRLKGLEYRYDSENAPQESPHVFVYTITIQNEGERTVKLLGRKWVITKTDGERIIVEGDKIVGEEPVLKKGEAFTYNSFHLLDQNATADGSYFAIDEEERPIVIPIPSFLMKIPGE